MRKVLSFAVFIICIYCSCYVYADIYDMQLGDLGKPDDYDQTIKGFKDFFRDTSGFDAYTAGVLPSRYDWRDEGVVTPAKDQGHCGSCWAFASVGALESKILMKENSEWDVSEQQLISCSRYDCNGGRSDAVFYWDDNGAMKEICTAYEDYSTIYPGVGSNVTCTSLDKCLELPYRVKGYYTVNTNDINEIKTSLYNDGPSYFSYMVFEDFGAFWNTGAKGQVYTQSTGGFAGGHAVLIIGWDDAKRAWLCKNSWGETSGPNRDGTFWIAYSGHANDLRFGMSNFTIVGYSEPNKPPTANAGKDQTLKQGETVTLDGSASKDPDDGIVSYQWKQTGGVSVNIQNAASQKASLTAPESQTELIFELTVTDKSGASDSDTCKVNVVHVSSPVLAVTPAVQNVSVSESTTSFSVQNTGSGDMNWTVSETASWIMIESGSSGINSGTIAIKYQTNTGGARSTTLTISAPGAKDSPKYVEIKQAAGTAGTFTFETMWPDSPYKFKWPHNINTDKEGNVYVADWGNGRIQKISPNGDILMQLNIPDCMPSAVAVDDSGNIYVGNHFNDISEIIKYSSTGEIITRWGSVGTGDGQFNSGDGTGLSDMVLGKDGYLYVVDRFNHRIQKFNSDGEFITKWGSKGSGDGQFNEPCGIEIDSMGNVYVAERHNQRVQKFTSDGTFILKWGKEGYWNNGEFSWPNNIAIDENDNVYISDIGTSIIQKFTPEGVFIKKWGGYGYENGKFTYPGSIVSDKNGNVYVLDGRIQKFTSDGLFITKWGSGFDDGDIARPRGIAVDSKENVYVVDSYERVQKFTKDGEFILKWGNSSDGGGIFGDPCGVAIDKNDNVYVIDTWNYRIQKFDTQGNFIKMWGSRGKGNGEFNYPIGIAVDKNGYVYVADAWNHCVQKFSSDGDFIIKWGSEGTENGEFKNLSDIAVDNKGNVYTAGNGVQVFTTNGDFILKWGNPYHWSGIAADEDGNVYLTYQNDRVQKYTTDGQLIAEFGEEGFDAGQFNNPSYLCVSPSGRIYIADTLNNRVQVFLENERASFDKDDDPNKPEPGDWVKISGKVTNQDGIPLCAMVLANGQHIFSCDGSGNYGLEVPVDENGQITLFAFCDGLAPFKYIFKPEKYSIEYNINMYPADSPLYMQLNPVITSSAKSGWVKIAGKVVNKDGVPLCAMVLANGQHMFSCEGEGKYELEVPLDENGQVTLFGFCDGVQPYKEIK